jgi:broad specificity phosphatase PhoE
MTLRIRRSLLFLSLLTAFLSLHCFAQVTVVLTRHAEKGSDSAKDPSLSEAGQKRAQLLASMLADSGVDAIYVTEYKRTQQTAAPLSERVRVKPTIVPKNQDLIAAIHARSSGVVVVVGHSNTVPQIIAALGGPPVTIDDPEYNNLFILTVGPQESTLLRLHYGDSTPTPSQNGNMTRPNQK